MGPSPQHFSPQGHLSPFNCKNEYLLFASLEETVTQAVVGWVICRLKNYKWSEDERPAATFYIAFALNVLMTTSHDRAEMLLMCSDNMS